MRGADTRIAWTDARTARPAWASGSWTPTTSQLGVLAAQSGWHIVLTLGIVHFHLVEVRAGEALRTLDELPSGVDLLFLDGRNDLYLDVLRLVEPRLASGAHS
ncbi:MAG TPA: hypothetical protein VLJ80_08465 [Solirubrobacteraceae bacterium]|nr:hypothetical protein [Solirubrobacteraceae bacterium]